MAESVEEMAAFDSQERVAVAEPVAEDEVEGGSAPVDLERAVEVELAPEREAAFQVVEGVSSGVEDWAEAAAGSRVAVARSTAIAPRSGMLHRCHTLLMHTSMDSSSRLVRTGKTLHTPHTVVLRSSCCPSRYQSGRISSLGTRRSRSLFANYARRCESSSFHTSDRKRTPQDSTCCVIYLYSLLGYLMLLRVCSQSA